MASGLFGTDTTVALALFAPATNRTIIALGSWQDGIYRFTLSSDKILYDAPTSRIYLGSAASATESMILEKPDWEIGALATAHFSNGSARLATGVNMSRNISRDLINHASTAGLIHGIYVAHSSQDNLIQENYIRNCRGSAIKFRDDSDNSHVIGNYVESSGEGTSDDRGAFLTDSFQSGVDSTNIEVRDNLLTFGYMSKAQALDVAHHAESFVIDAAQSSGSLLQPNQPTEEDVTAMAVADIDGDALCETFVALYYPGLGFTKVVHSDGRSKTLSRVAPGRG
jgi:hypothetical protein